MAITTTHNTYGAKTSINVKKVITSKIKSKNGFVYPLAGSFKTAIGKPPELRTNLNEGGYFSKAQGLSLIKNNLRQLLLCERGERIMLPNYGVSLQKYLFEPLDETTFYLIKTEILKTLKTYFSMAHVISISVLSNELEAVRSEIVVKLTLQLLDGSLDIFDAEVKVA
jgi:phage baseplate assembly protein W